MRVTMVVRAAAQFSPSLKELRIHCCQSSAESKGLRDFVTKYYKELKGSNPQLPILVRECAGVQPKVWGRFDYGKEDSVILSNKTADEVKQSVDSFIKSNSK